MKVITRHIDEVFKIPIKIWSEDEIEEDALQQAYNLAKLPFVFHHLAFMPDMHSGYGMPIGGVMATKRVIIPNAIGKDIGCGMSAVPSTIKADSIPRETLLKIIQEIKNQIPVGYHHHTVQQIWEGFDQAPDIPIIQKELEAAKYQLGTLGGGNHFIEIQVDDKGYFWIMLHSGSRNFGLKICDEYHKKAVYLCEDWHSNIPSKDLSFLPIETVEAKEYLKAMNYALNFAYASRRAMMNCIMDIFRRYVSDIRFLDIINIHHNYAAWENHFGQNVIVHRKGATSAKAGQIGIIPGSQGSSSYIVKGLGNKESFESCSHGAGRKMGRNRAKQILSLKEEKKHLEDLGIIHSIEDVNDLEEATGAYKNIESVMKYQQDLVEIMTVLRPLAVIKSKNSLKDWKKKNA